GREAREALGNLDRVRVGIAVHAPPIEIRRLYYERVAIPVAARIAHIEVDLRADVRTRLRLDGNHPRLVDHLVENRDVSLPLHDAVRVAVNRRHHRAGIASGDAAVVQA